MSSLENNFKQIEPLVPEGITTVHCGTLLDPTPALLAAKQYAVQTKHEVYVLVDVAGITLRYKIISNGFIGSVFAVEKLG